MRFARFAAFALWLTIALLAIAGFAAFSPQTAPTTTTSTSVAAPRSAGADWGSSSGRVVALVFTSGLQAAPELSDLSAEDSLISDLLGDRPVVTTPTVAPESVAAERDTPPTTSPPQTTTTTPAPTTTTITTPPATTTTTTQQAGGKLSETEARGIIALFFAPDDVELALEIAYCESRWDPGVTNGSSGAAGLFQHLPRFWVDRSEAAGWAGANLYDAHANTAVSAWLVYQGGGWSHWAESQACWG
ncbi:MAG: hypothetical protein OEM81_05670 [Acidimicrobiia bacterium]|nr:hypothetical protein [Acidimicrobiia bacterium]MDH3397306.1 hypothetical protein [Acidimicrobiia bacterium]